MKSVTDTRRGLSTYCMDQLPPLILSAVTLLLKARLVCSWTASRWKLRFYLSVLLFLRPLDSGQDGGGTPLQTGYCFWFMRRGKGASKEASGSSEASPTEKDVDKDSLQVAVNPYENSIKIIATIKTVEEFWSVYDFLVRPNDLPITTDYHFFRDGIKPTWEDISNSKGGKWIVRLRKGLASRYWEEIMLAIIGGQFSVPDGEICGAVVSIRFSEDIVSVWNRNANDRDVTERLRDSIKKILQLPSHVHMEYKPHQASLQDKSSFRNTQVWKPKSAMTRESTTDGGIRRSGSWGERDELRGKPRRDIERSWRS